MLIIYFKGLCNVAFPPGKLQNFPNDLAIRLKFFVDSVKPYTSINQSVLLLIQIVAKYDQLMFMSCFAKENLRCLIHWGHFLINEVE